MYLLRPRFELSVIIPTCDDDLRLRAVLDGFVAQTVPEFDLHVVNDGGPDSTAGVVQEYSDRLHIYYHYRATRGFSAGGCRNLGMSHSAATRVLLCDGDVVPSAGVVQLHSGLGRAPVVGLGLRHNIPRQLVEEVILPAVALGMLQTRDLALYPHGPDPRSQCPTFRALLGGTVPTPQELTGHAKFWNYNAAGVIRKGLWRAWSCFSFCMSVPGTHRRFDHRFDGSYGDEDLEFGLRLIAAGLDVRVLPDSLVYHLGHRQRLQTKNQRAILNETLYRILAADELSPPG